MPWMGPPLQGGMGYSLGLDPQQAALVDLYRAAQGGNLVDMYRLNQMHSLVNAGAAAHMLYTPVPTTVPSLHPHLPGTQTTSTAVLEAPSSVLQPPPPPPISALHYHQMAAALVGLSETQRATIMALEGRCHRCSACDSGMGPCLMMSKSPPSLPGVQSNASTTSTRSSNSASSSPPNTPSPLSRTSPSSTTTPKNEAPKPFNSTPPVGGNVSEPSRLHPLFRSPSFLPSGPTSLLCPSNLLPYRPPLKFAGSVPNFSSGAETSQPISSNFSAFSAPKQSPRSVDSSRALQLAAVDSTNGSSPKSSSVRTYESSDVTRNMDMHSQGGRRLRVPACYRIRPGFVPRRSHHCLFVPDHWQLEEHVQQLLHWTLDVNHTSTTLIDTSQQASASNCNAEDGHLA
ncbi:hypothetical protein FHG87_013164 [Trinorchestia longiramus]|nr:hypothetical protein FHG87_013164 [Trinorchestia longiramus]